MSKEFVMKYRRALLMLANTVNQSVRSTVRVARTLGKSAGAGYSLNTPFSVQKYCQINNSDSFLKLSVKVPLSPLVHMISVSTLED